MMEYKVDGWNNFCRVFEVPKIFSPDFCFSGGISTNFLMVNWFNPIPNISQPAVSKEVWEEKVGDIEIKSITHDELIKDLVPFVESGNYCKKGYQYLILCNFGAAILFTKGGEKEEK